MKPKISDKVWVIIGRKVSSKIATLLAVVKCLSNHAPAALVFKLRLMTITRPKSGSDKNTVANHR